MEGFEARWVAIGKHARKLGFGDILKMKCDTVVRVIGFYKKSVIIEEAADDGNGAVYWLPPDALSECQLYLPDCVVDV